MGTNVNSEMSDLVHRAEEWVATTGFNRVPEVSLRELRSHRIGRKIVTRAAFMLLEQLGIRSVEDYTKHFGEVNEEKETAISPVSPMPIEEFQSILKNGWPLDGPCSPRRQSSLLRELIPLSPIKSETGEISPKMFAVPRLIRKSEPARRLLTTTPKQKKTRRIGTDTTTPTAMRREIMTPKRATSTPGLVRESIVPMNGETPMENRASRLRRLKLEEKRRSLGGERDASMNSSFGFK